ncbi:MAG TPA: dienelactone hydrolase family protein [Planctomycetota bacterium]|nr:dienelactone hydrolase family protein [Planctomycetota bacterium]
MKSVLSIVVFVFLGLSPAASRAALETRPVEYRDGDTTLIGYVALDPAKLRANAAGVAPGVLIIHQWMGPTDYEKGRAHQLADLGYVAFVADIYGKDLRPKDRGEAAVAAGKFKTDRALFRKRLQLGFDQLRGHPKVDPARTAAIGYCFGGTGVLELARSGAAVSGVVSFHGGLDSPAPADGKNIKARVLVLHGADDPFVPADQIEAFKKELNDAKVDWQMVYYSGAVHAFTQKLAGNDKSTGAAYEEKADRRSWTAMRDFFDEVLPVEK